MEDEAGGQGSAEAPVWALNSVQELSGWVTAGATIALALLTLALVFFTFRMASAMFRPHVVADLESNQWSSRHLDVVIENCGNAPAYDVSVKFDPPIEPADAKGDVPFPSSKIGIIRPRQSLVSYATEWYKIRDKVLRIEISWKRHPRHSKREVLSYELNMKSLDGMSHLGKRNSMIQVAEEMKKLREDWKSVAQGKRRTQVDVFNQDDRDAERPIKDAHLAELRERRDAETPSES